MEVMNTMELSFVRTLVSWVELLYQRINYDSVASNMDALNSKKTKHGIKMVDATHKPSGFGPCPDVSCYCSRLFPATSPAQDEKKKFTMNKIDLMLKLVGYFFMFPQMLHFLKLIAVLYYDFMLTIDPGCVAGFTICILIYIHPFMLVMQLGENQITVMLILNLQRLVLLICLTKVAKSAFNKALAEHEDIDDVVGSEEPTERDHGVDLQQPLLIEINSSDSHQK
ncbi:hypothetical protein OROGR_028462 [Orobanche gracilis]